MKRKNLFLSPLSLSLTLFLFLVLGSLLWVKRAMLFSPGLVSAKDRPGVTLAGFSSHAEFEMECEHCHQPLETSQDVLCLECHSSVSDQLSSKRGVHAQMENRHDCAACHPDHQGRDFDPTAAALLLFDHSVTDFSLDSHQFDYQAVPLVCEACHFMGDEFALNGAACQTCHSDHDRTFMTQHTHNFGVDCLDCHDGLDTLARFNHRDTDFPLDGQHTQVDCADCHTEERIEDIVSNCAACHQEADLHRGIFDQDCSTCHTTMDWSPAIMNGIPFEHGRDANFSLALHGQTFDDDAITCADCHPESIQDFSLDQCMQCHASQDANLMNEHQSVFSSDCLECHDGVDRMSNFDHNNIFELDGRHAEIDCESCHANKTFRGTPTECTQCHAEPQIHLGSFGLQCQNCHLTTAWQPARLVRHTFPLDHGESDQITCEVCHTSTYIEYTCYECHEHQSAEVVEKHMEEGISRQELINCVDCHPTGKEDESD